MAALPPNKSCHISAWLALLNSGFLLHQAKNQAVHTVICRHTLLE
jgi:hypothetical protein